MPNYDSSSDEDEDQYTETNVLLGYVSSSAPEDVSYLGGTPQWFDPSSPPSAALARCKICHDIMALLLQLNGELPDIHPGHERRLYVLGCKKRTCQRKEGSVRAIRGVRIDQSIARKAKEDKNVKKEEKATSTTPSVVKSTGLGESLFGAPPAASNTNNTNPFSTGSIKAINPFSSPTGTQSNPFASPSAFPPLSTLSAKPSQRPDTDPSSLPQTFASTLTLNTPATPKHSPIPEPWPTALPTPYPTLYFDAVEREQLDPENIPAPPQNIAMDLDEPSNSSSSQKEDKEIYESTIDTDFQRFADRLAQNPEQVIRYEWGGIPLLYTKSDKVGKLLAGSRSRVGVSGGSGNGMPRCGACGGDRVFEVQLTPGAIMELEGDVLEDGMEWGTVIVGVCEADCAVEGGYGEEWCGVQWEEKVVR